MAQQHLTATVDAHTLSTPSTLHTMCTQAFVRPAGGRWGAGDTTARVLLVRRTGRDRPRGECGSAGRCNPQAQLAIAVAGLQPAYRSMKISPWYEVGDTGMMSATPE
eukprot:354163-Chlamydomonas_euryale.AAC.3